MCQNASGNHCHHSVFRDLGLLCLRVAIGVIFIYMGHGKLGPNHAGATAMMAGIGLPGDGSFWAYFVGSFELLGGIMVLLGAYARYVAIWLSIIMIVAMSTVHRGSPTLSGYFLPIAVLGGCLALLGVGAGKYRLIKSQHLCRCGKMDSAATKSGCCGGGCGGEHCNDEKAKTAVTK